MRVQRTEVQHRFTVEDCGIALYDSPVRVQRGHQHIVRNHESLPARQAHAQQERIAALGGSVTLESPSAGGFAVVATIPLHDERTA